MDDGDNDDRSMTKAPWTLVQACLKWPKSGTISNTLIYLISPWQIWCVVIITYLFTFRNTSSCKQCKMRLHVHFHQPHFRIFSCTSFHGIISVNRFLFGIGSINAKKDTRIQSNICQEEKFGKKYVHVSLFLLLHACFVWFSLRYGYVLKT